MPPISERGNVLCGSMVSSATLAVFSKPVIAKNDERDAGEDRERRVAVGVEVA